MEPPRFGGRGVGMPGFRVAQGARREAGTGEFERVNRRSRRSVEIRSSRMRMVRKGGLEPPWVTPPDPKSGASANSATFAAFVYSDLRRFFFLLFLPVADLVTTAPDETSRSTAA